MDRLSDDLLLLTIACSRGRVGRVYTIGYALMAAELIRLAARERIEICDDQIVVMSAEPTADAQLDAALAGIAEWTSPPRPDEWVARPRLRIHGGYLERLAAAGVVRAQSRFSARRWRVNDASRLAEARQRLDLIAGSAGAVDLEQALSSRAVGRALHWERIVPGLTLGSDWSVSEKPADGVAP